MSSPGELTSPQAVAVRAIQRASSFIVVFLLFPARQRRRPRFVIEKSALFFQAPETAE
jgi:hypothetical protein